MTKARSFRAARWVRRLTRIVLAPIVGALTFAVVTVAGLVLWMGLAPLNLTPFLPHLTPELNRQLGIQKGIDEEFGLDGLVIIFDRITRSFEFEATGLRIARDDGAEIALDRAFIKLPLDGFGSGRLSPIILSGLSAEVRRDEDGLLTVNGFTIADLRRISALRRTSDTTSPPPILVTDIDARLEDEVSNLDLPLRADRIDVISLRSSTEVFGQVRVKEGDFVGSKVNANLSVPRDDTNRSLNLDLQGFNLSRLERSGLIDLEDLTLTGLATGNLAMSFDPSFKILNTKGSISLERAGLAGDALPEDLDVLFAEADFTYQPQDNTFSFENVIATGDIWTAGLSLDGTLVENENGEVSQIQATARTLSATLNAPEYFPAPHQFRAEEVLVNMQLAPWAIDLTGDNIELDGVSMSVLGASSVEDGEFVHRYRATSAPRSVEDVMTFWPQDVIPNTRAWGQRALHDATISNLDFAVSAIGSDVNLRMTFDYSELNAKIIKAFPQVSNASGSVSLTENDFTVNVRDGTVYFPIERGGVHAVNVSGSRFYIPSLAEKTPDAEAQVLVSGTLGGAEAALDHPPFGFLTKSGTAFPNASGRVMGQIDLIVPMQKQITTQDVDVQAAFDVTNFRSRDLLKDRLVSSERLNVTTDGASLRATGAVRLNDLFGSLEMVQDFSEDGKTNAVVETDLTQAFAAEFDLPTDVIRMEGAAPLRVEVDLSDPNAVSFNANSNLVGLGLSVPMIAWSKPKANEVSFSVAGSFSEGQAAGIDFELDAKGLTANGVVSEGSTRISNAQIGSWFAGGAEFEPGQPVSIQAERIDLRYLPNALSSGGSANMALATDRLVVSKNIYISDLSGRFEARKADIFTGRLNGQVPVQIAITQGDNGPVYTITGNNAGRAMAILGVLDDVRDGDFRVELSETNQGLLGRFELKSIRVRTASPLVSLLDAISLVGLVQQLDGPGLRFQTVRGRFLIAENGVEIRKVSAVGASLGFTTAGVYLPETASLDLEGTVTPLYPINGMFERTFKKPFGRERGEGLFSFTYRMKGKAEDPSVRVNPLSILFPGVLREIFRTKTPTLPDTPS